jgi:hypothetical protein
MFGCLDIDGDGVSNSADAFPRDSTQTDDTDQDGYGDNSSGNLSDSCPTVYGTSIKNNTLGCVDGDDDGWADFDDKFPYDSSQWVDSDKDGFGDQLNGFQGDECPYDVGNSTVDRFGCLDLDGDGTSDKNDVFPNNPTQTTDRDGDGYGDNQESGATQVDDFPSDTTQWNDTDGDGYGDNPNGNLADRFPNDPNLWQDSDLDGVADEDDAFPNERSQSEDLDGDGYGDNPDGENPDAFPSNPDEWLDTIWTDLVIMLTHSHSTRLKNSMLMVMEWAITQWELERINSLTRQHNGAILMAMDMETIRTEQVLTPFIT